MFHHHVQHPDPTICINGHYQFAASVEEQIQRICLIREHILSDAIAWFAQFSTIEFVVASLKAKDFGTLRLENYATQAPPKRRHRDS